MTPKDRVALLMYILLILCLFFRNYDALSNRILIHVFSNMTWVSAPCVPQVIPFRDFPVKSTNIMYTCPITQTMTAIIPNRTLETSYFSNKLQKQTFTPSSHCPRYLVRSNGEEGLGHRHISIAVLANLAVEFHFEILLHDSLVQGGKHGDYPQAQDMLGFSSVKRLSQIINKDQMQFISAASVVDFFHLYMSKLKDQCNIIVSVETGNGDSCGNSHGNRDWCFTSLPGFINKAYRFFIRPRLTDTLQHSPVPMTEENALLVVWHVRCGDVTVYHHDDFYLNIYHLIYSQQVPCIHLYLGDCDQAHYQRLRNLIPGLQNTPIDDKQGVHSIMKQADVLIHGGSTFSLSAHLSSTHRQLFFQTPDKEGSITKTSYAFQAAIHIDDTGNIEPGQKVDVHDLMNALYCLKFGTCTAEDGGKAWTDFDSFNIIASYIPMGEGEESTLKWLKNSEMAASFLPTCTIVLYYNISAVHPSICNLRPLNNVVMVDASSFNIPQEKWPYEILHSVDHRFTNAIVFRNPSLPVLTTCDLQEIGV